MPIAIRECPADEIVSAANFDALCAAYAAESGIPELGTANVDIPMYRSMEAVGMGCCIGAWDGDELVGFAALTLQVMPHFSKRIGCLISFFVVPRARKGGTGTRIRQVAEGIALARGAVGMMISAPSESRLDMVLPRSGYRATNRLYFKSFGQ
jgi:hypothetical protein